MFSQPYFYLYVISSVLVFALGNTMKKNDPANPLAKSVMGIAGLVTNLANYALLVLCLFFAEHWWYAIVMWVVGFVLSIVVPPNKIQDVLGYIGIVGAPVCTLFAYLSLF